MEEKKNSLNEEYAPEISPGYRQDVRDERSSKFSPLFIGLAVFAFALLLLLSYLL